MIMRLALLASRLLLRPWQPLAIAYLLVFAATAQGYEPAYDIPTDRARANAKARLLQYAAVEPEDDLLAPVLTTDEAVVAAAGVTLTGQFEAALSSLVSPPVGADNTSLGDASHGLVTDAAVVDLTKASTPLATLLSTTEATYTTVSESSSSPGAAFAEGVDEELEKIDALKHEEAAIQGTLFDAASLLQGGLPLHLTRRLLELASNTPKQIQQADMYGGIYDYAYYFISLLVGTPPQRQSVILDSGSSLLGFACSDCVHCGRQHIDRAFDVVASQTAVWMPCDSPKCITRRCGTRPTSLTGQVGVSTCRYSQSYSEGSSIEGSFVSDMVVLGDRVSIDGRILPATRFDYIGCHDLETNLFTSQKASGILGVSYPKKGRQPTLIDAIFGSDTVDSKVFAICASEEGGVLSVGGFDSSRHVTSLTNSAPNLRLLGLAQRARHDMSFRAEFVEPMRAYTSRRRRVSAVVPEPTDYLAVLLDEALLFAPPTARRLADNDSTVVINPASGGTNVLTDKSAANKVAAATVAAVNVTAATVKAAELPQIAWTPITSSASYQIEVAEIRMLPGTLSSAAAAASSNRTAEAELIASANEIGAVIVDSGTTFSYLASQAFKAFMAAMDRACVADSEHCISRMRTTSDQLCWRVREPTDFGYAPSFILTLGSGAKVEWRPVSYLHRRAKTDEWCLAVDDNMSRQTILGMSFLKQNDVIFDRERNLVGFVSADCKSISDIQRPPPPTKQPPLSVTAVTPFRSPMVSSKSIIATDAFSQRLQQAWVATPMGDAAGSVTLTNGYNGQLFLFRSPQGGGGFSPLIMWASGGAAVAICVLGMAAITRRSVRNSTNYSPAPGSPHAGGGSISSQSNEQQQLASFTPFDVEFGRSPEATLPRDAASITVALRAAAVEMPGEEVLPDDADGPTRPHDFRGVGRADF